MKTEDYCISKRIMVELLDKVHFHESEALRLKVAVDVMNEIGQELAEEHEQHVCIDCSERNEKENSH